MALIDQLDPDGAWAVRDAVYSLCRSLTDMAQQDALALLLFEIAEAVQRVAA